MTPMNKERSTEEQRLSFEAARGDVGAFSLLISRYTNSLRHFVSGYCSNSCDIEDICQETLRKAFMAISTFNPEMKFKNWLFEIAKNSALDNARRKKNALKTVDINDMSDESLESNDTSYISPEEKLIEIQKYNSFINAIDALPPLYKDAAKLRLVYQFSYKEIAKELDLPLNTVRTRIRRARKLIETNIE